MINTRDEIINRLNSFYEKEGIVPSNFTCKNSSICEAQAGRELCGRGAQAHVGTKYTNEFRVVFLSLDTGGCGRDTIQERTDTVESALYSKTTKQTKGTI